MESKTKAGRYAWTVMGRTLAYAAGLVPEAADEIVAIDEAMRLGYNWKAGPFELIDKLGAAWFAKALRGRGHRGARDPREGGGQDVLPARETANGSSSASTVSTTT